MPLPQRTQISQLQTHPSYLYAVDSHSPSNVQEAISRALSSLAPEAEVLMVLDSPDVPIGTANANASSLLSLIYSLRELVHSTVILLPADIFQHHHSYHDHTNSTHVPTPLDIEQQQFLLSLTHQADYLLSTRNLDTGVAKDVSGVIRITQGGRGEEDSAIAKDKEYLYLVDANRSVKVWERGSDVRP